MSKCARTKTISRYEGRPGGCVAAGPQQQGQTLRARCTSHPPSIQPAHQHPAKRRCSQKLISLASLWSAGLGVCELYHFSTFLTWSPLVLIPLWGCPQPLAGGGSWQEGYDGLVLFVCRALPYLVLEYLQSYSACFDFPKLRFSIVYLHVHAGILFFTAQASSHNRSVASVCLDMGRVNHLLG